MGPVQTVYIHDADSKVETRKTTLNYTISKMTGFVLASFPRGSLWILHLQACVDL